jgi:hypothetical protein
LTQSNRMSGKIILIMNKKMLKIIIIKCWLFKSLNYSVSLILSRYFYNILADSILYQKILALVFCVINYYNINASVQSFSFKLTALGSTFLYISIGFSLAVVAFYMKKTVHWVRLYFFYTFSMVNIMRIVHLA